MTDLSAYDKGLQGEKIACEYLTNKGMVLLFQRYHSPFGEIDLVMQDGDVLVFVEVKRRTRSGVRSGEMAVTSRKQRRIIQTARYFLTEYPREAVIRFDILEITKDGILHLPDAFQGHEWD